MNPLLAKYNDYKTICNYRVVFLLEDGSVISYTLKKSSFVHLTGLHKLTDIRQIQLLNNPERKDWTAARICREIEKETITEKTIADSTFFSSIQDRYYYFSSENLLSLQYADVIVNFDPTVIHSSLNSKYILIDKTSSSSLITHLCIAEDRNKNFYIESFFTSYDNRYEEGQTLLKIREIQIFDKNGNTFLYESFQ